MKRKTVNLVLKKDNNEKVVVDLRLTIRGQYALEKKHGERGISLIMSAVDDTEIMLDIFQYALNYDGNTNEITDAEDLYDLLVDNDYQGLDGFAALMLQIGEASGFLKKKQAERLAEGIAKNFEKAFDSVEESLTGTDKDEEEKTPSEEE